jgi:hypothetical protein
MSAAARPDTAGKTRTCPHCKATILESLTICPGCLHHLRFDQEAAKRQVAAASALRVEGVISHPSAAAEPWEYFVVIAVRNERGEEVTRHVVNVGALRNTEKRTFALSVDVMTPQPVVVPNKPVVPQPSGPAPRGPAPRAPLPPAAKPPATSAPGTAPLAKGPTATQAPSGAAPAPKGPLGPTPPPKR